MPELRSREEFFLGGAVPVPAQPDNGTICNEPLEIDVIKILACGHTFHLVCVLAWFQSSSARHGSCPNCRRQLFGPDPRPVPTAAPEPALTLEDAIEHEIDAFDAVEHEFAALIAERNAEMAEAVQEYRQSGAQAPHPAW
jgi:hypothetical protein